MASKGTVGFKEISFIFTAMFTLILATTTYVSGRLQEERGESSGKDRGGG